MEVDDLLGLDLPEGSTQATRDSATELLTATAKSAANGVTVLTLGPLTNVAEALQADPSLADGISGIYAMGGAVEVNGNVGPSIGIPNRYAEWNIYGDPHAAKIVFESGIPVTLVPLDATNDVPVTVPFKNNLDGSAESEPAQFVGQVLERRFPSIVRGDTYFWDPFAAAVLVDESITSFETASLTAETEEGPDSGRVIEAADGPNVRYAISGNREAFEQELIDTLNGR